MARIRSPNYPQLSLPAALSRIEVIFAKEHQHPAPREVVAQHLGYGGLNGASMGTISALGKYGLLEKVGEDLKVSDRALAIMHPSSTQERQEQLQAAAEAPALFSELMSHFSGKLPSDENLRSFLVRRGFSQNSLDNVIDVLRETMEYVGQPARSNTATPPKPSIDVVATTTPIQRSAAPWNEFNPQAQPTKPGSVSVALEDDQLRITAVLVDQKGVDKLIQALQANKVLLPVIHDSFSIASSQNPLPTTGTATDVEY